MAARAAELAKADLLSGMVGEFPELQGVMGRYYALRRAALGIIRIIRENKLRTLRFSLVPLFAAAQIPYAEAVGKPAMDPGLAQEVMNFLADRLLVQLRTEGSRHDVLSAVFAAGADDDIARLLAKADAVAALLASKDGADLLTAYRRAANILRIEDRKDGPHAADPDLALLQEAEEVDLNHALDSMHDVTDLLAREDYATAMSRMSRLRAPLDAFFERVTVNAAEPELRRNRLFLLHRVRSAMDRVADFSRIES